MVCAKNKLEMQLFFFFFSVYALKTSAQGSGFAGLAKRGQRR